jgi:hypothetical protein
MARRIQSQSDGPQASIGAFLKLLTGGVGWLFMATFVPIQALLDDFPALAPYAHWAPILFYILAFWTFSRAIRTLQRLGASRMWTPRIRAAGPTTPAQPAGGKRAKTGLVAVTRPPTVQRMR